MITHKNFMVNTLRSTFSSSHWPANLSSLIKIDMFPKVQVLTPFPTHVARVNMTNCVYFTSAESLFKL